MLTRDWTIVVQKLFVLVEFHLHNEFVSKQPLFERGGGSPPATLAHDRLFMKEQCPS